MIKLHRFPKNDDGKGDAEYWDEITEQRGDMRTDPWNRVIPADIRDDGGESSKREGDACSLPIHGGGAATENLNGVKRRPQGKTDDADDQ